MQFVAENDNHDTSISKSKQNLNNQKNSDYGNKYCALRMTCDKFVISKRLLDIWKRKYKKFLSHIQLNHCSAIVFDDKQVKNI